MHKWRFFFCFLNLLLFVLLNIYFETGSVGWVKKVCAAGTASSSKPPDGNTGERQREEKGEGLSWRRRRHVQDSCGVFHSLLLLLLLLLSSAISCLFLLFRRVKASSVPRSAALRFKSWRVNSPRTRGSAPRNNSTQIDTTTTFGASPSVWRWGPNGTPVLPVHHAENSSVVMSHLYY